MGSPLSPIVSNIFMDHFEDLTLNNYTLKPKCWFQFVDDTFFINPHDHSTLDSFSDHLNNLLLMLVVASDRYFHIGMCLACGTHQKHSILEFTLV